jgi:FtsP/CotA-like multicopper oxidase with cupredoxin domain
MGVNELHKVKWTMATTHTPTDHRTQAATGKLMWLRNLGGKIKHNKLKTLLITIASVVIIVTSLSLYLANASKWPDAINMSSDTHTHRAGLEPTPMESLILGETDAPLKNYALTADVITRAGLSDMWGYNGSVPGPELRVKQGDHVRVTLTNNLPVATTIHWHGINVPNRADGVAGVTQDAVQPGASYTYDFIATEAGTYWYHSHQDTSNQIVRGLLGALVVEPENLQRYDRDYTLMYHDFTPPSRNLIDIVQKIAGEVDEDAIAVNGSNTAIKLDAEPGDFIRLRLINGTAGEQTAFGDPLRIALLGASYQVVALDGHDLNEPEEISAQIMPIGSGQRYDLVFRMPESGIVRLVGEDFTATVTLGQGEIVIPDLSTLPTFDLTTYGNPTNDPIASRSRFDATYDLVFGNRPGFHNGSFGLVHTINEEAFPDTPMITVQPGQVVRLHMVNETDEYHPIHIHGHYFTVLAKNDVSLSGSPVHLDSILLAPEETWDVAFVADNPGLWMLHCHVLIHAATGMDMMVVYPNIATPYSIGERSGNIPE